MATLTKRFDDSQAKLDDFQAKTESNFSDLSRQIRDISLDTPTRREFNKHEVRIVALEQSAGL